MRKLLTILAIILVSATTFSRELTPEEALEAASQSKVSAAMKVKSTHMRLARTLSANNTPTLYIFTAEQAKGGFMICAADDAVPALLAYSETEVFAAEDIPDNLNYWLNQYSLYIDQVRAKAAPHRVVQFDEHPSIAPLMTTAWNQNEPYNALCPVVNGSRSVTGCVATAMSQVLNTYRWPKKGVGSYTYSFTASDKKTYTQTFNYGDTEFSWINMADRYYTATSGTELQRKAVATLMSAVGIAADMNYSPSGSGGNNTTLLRNLVEHMKYDRSVELQQRDWYSPVDWDNMVYNELAGGYPVYYCGNDTKVGHAFVIDGYSSNQYYHVNWGWGGVYDGYFILANLYPEGQGIGGGTGEQGFNYGQEICIKLRKAADGAPTSPLFTAMAFLDNLSINNYMFQRGANSVIDINSNFGNVSLCDISNFDVGVELVNTDDATDVQHVISFHYDDTLPCFYYFSGALPVNADNIPLGKWHMYPAFRIGNGEWVRMHTPVNNGSVEYLNVSANETIVTVTKPRPDINNIMTAQLSSWTETSGKVDAFIPGYTYNLTFDVTSSNNWNGDLAALLCEKNSNVVAQSDSQSCNLNGGTTKSITFTLQIPKDITIGEYNLALGIAGVDTYDIIPYTTPIEIVGEDEEKLVMDYTGYKPMNFADRGIYAGHTYDFNFNIERVSRTNIYLGVGILDSTPQYVAYTQPQYITLNKGTNNVSLSLEVPSDLQPGNYYLVPLAIIGNEYTYVDNISPITIDPVISNIESKLVKFGLGNLTITSEGYTLNLNSNYNIEFEVSSTVPWQSLTGCSIFRPNADGSNEEVYTSEEVELQLSGTEPNSVDFMINVPTSVGEGDYAMAITYKDNGNRIAIMPYYSIKLKTNGAGVENVAIDTTNDADTQLYDMNGRLVTQPESGVYIRRIGSKTEKVIIR